MLKSFLGIIATVLLASQMAVAGGISSGSPVEQIILNVQCGGESGQKDVIFIDVFSGESFSSPLGKFWKTNIQMYSSKALNYLTLRARSDFSGKTVLDGAGRPVAVSYSGKNLTLKIDLQNPSSNKRFVSQLTGLDDSGQAIPAGIPLFCSIKTLP